jgi:hypothetical protein
MIARRAYNFKAFAISEVCEKGSNCRRFFFCYFLIEKGFVCKLREASKSRLMTNFLEIDFCVACNRFRQSHPSLPGSKYFKSKKTVPLKITPRLADRIFISHPLTRREK